LPGEIGHRQVFRVGAREARHSSRYFVDVVRASADLNFCNAWNHLRYAHRHKQMVRAGIAFVENVRTPDVCRRRARECGEYRDEGKS
jgi:hypothetical protein